jgi:hypothetical protein
MMIALGAGLEWLGRFATKQGRALYLDYENGLYEMRRRIQVNARSLDLATVDGIGIISMPPVYMNAPGFGEYLRAAAEGRDVVIIDTLKAGNPGCDENDSNMRTGLDAARREGERSGFASVVLAHAKKLSGSATDIDPREAGRGSSAIFDAADVVLHVTYFEGKPLLVRQTKARFGRPVDPFQVEILDGGGGAVRVEASIVPAADSSASRRFEELCTRVLGLVRSLHQALPGGFGAQRGASARLLAEEAGARYAAVKAALEHLERHGAVKNLGDKNAGNWIPSGPGFESEGGEGVDR